MSTEFEAKLQELITANQEPNRTRWAKEWKKSGGKVAGILCTYVPVEVLVAAGVMPWRVTGTWSQRINDALAIRAANSCGYCNNVLQSLLDDELSFLDGVIATTVEQDITRLWDVWKHLEKTPFTHVMHLPHFLTDEAIRFYAGEIAEFIPAVEAFAGREIGDGDLRRAIDLCNRRRSLVHEVYELRRRDIPPLTGAEMVGLTVAGTIMPIDQYNDALAALLPYLKERKAPLSSTSPRILLSSDYIDGQGYVEAIESIGCLVAMDDFDTGSRYYDRLVDIDGKDPKMALSERYLSRVGMARMVGWPDQAEAVVRWVKEYRIDGVIELSQRYSRARELRRPFFMGYLEKAGIKAISLEREYPLASVGQIGVRAQAFLEMLS